MTKLSMEMRLDVEMTSYCIEKGKSRLTYASSTLKRKAYKS